MSTHSLFLLLAVAVTAAIVMTSCGGGEEPSEVEEGLTNVIETSVFLDQAAVAVDCPEYAIGDSFECEATVTSGGERASFPVSVTVRDGRTFDYAYNYEIGGTSQDLSGTVETGSRAD